MGKAVDLMMSGKFKGAKVNENGGPVSTGNGGLKVSIAMKNANIKAPSVTSVNPVTGSKQPAGEKLQNLF